MDMVDIVREKKIIYPFRVLLPGLRFKLTDRLIGENQTKV